MCIQVSPKATKYSVLASKSHNASYSDTILMIGDSKYYYIIRDKRIYPNIRIHNHNRLIDQYLDYIYCIRDTVLDMQQYTQKYNQDYHTTNCNNQHVIIKHIDKYRGNLYLRLCSEYKLIVSSSNNRNYTTNYCCLYSDSHLTFYSQKNTIAHDLQKRLYWINCYISTPIGPLFPKYFRGN